MNEWLIVALVLLVLFGATRLPKLARSMGQAGHELRAGLSRKSDEETETSD